MSRDRLFNLRFDISAEEQRCVRAEFFTAGAQAVEKSRHLSVYLDTPDAVLREHGLLWCFSRKDKLRDGRMKLGEWRLDRENGARSFIKKHKLFNRLGGVFTLRLDRERILHQAGQTLIEICLERGDFRCGPQSAVTSEAHFILHDGEAEDLVQLVSKVLPHAGPVSALLTPVERGYRLAGYASCEPPDISSTMATASVLNKDMPAAEAFKLIARREIGAALAEPPPIDGPSLRQNRLAIRRVNSALRFFSSVAAGAVDAEKNSFAAWEAALEKLYDLDVVLTAFLKPAVLRGQWEAAANLVARVSKSWDSTCAMLAQSWPDARVKSMFSNALKKLEEPLPISVAGHETLAVFMARELANAAGDIEGQAKAFRDAIECATAGKSLAGEVRCLKKSVACLQDAIGFFEPLTKGKAAKRRTLLSAALEDLEALLDKDYYVNSAQTLVADAAAHIARMKQTKSQNAQIYAAGALTGFLEALKPGDLENELTAALEAFAEVKPFWTKID